MHASSKGKSAGVVQWAYLKVLEDAADDTGCGTEGAVEHVDILRLGVDLLGLTIADLNIQRFETSRTCPP